MRWGAHASAPTRGQFAPDHGNKTPSRIARSHDLAVASTMMRRILVNHELAHRANKRNAELVSVTLSGLEQLGAAPDHDLVAVHQAVLAFE